MSDFFSYQGKAEAAPATRGKPIGIPVKSQSSCC